MSIYNSRNLIRPLDSFKKGNPFCIYNSRNLIRPLDLNQILEVKSKSTIVEI